MNAPAQRLVIAVDGPAASGKGTLAKRLAEHFGLPYLDTGKLYRAVACEVLLRIPTLEDDAIAQTAIDAAQQLDLTACMNQDLEREEVSKAASIVSAIPAVRTALFDHQRNFAANPAGAVLDGRDIGTVICPDATVKLFVTASPEIRAKRRFLQQQAAGREADYETILEAIRSRDARDSGRSTAPLKAAEDAIPLDTNHLNAEEVFQKAAALVRGVLAGTA